MKPSSFAASITLLAVSAAPHGVLASQPAALEDIASVCLETPLRNCRVLTAGFINIEGGDDEGAPRLAWQTQAGFTPEDGVLGGFVLFQHGRLGWSLLDSGFEGWYAMPVVNEADLLHVAGYAGGTGAYNVDRLYQWGDLGFAVLREGWRRVDMDGWLETIGEMLPEGLEIWKGVAYDFRSPWGNPVARTPLWRSTDANCCPTGGEAVVTFEIENHRLVVTEMRYFAPPDGTAQ